MSSSHLVAGRFRKGTNNRPRYKVPDLGRSVHIENISIGGQTAEIAHRVLVEGKSDPRPDIAPYDWVLKQEWDVVLLLLGSNDWKDPSGDLSAPTPKEQGKRVASLLLDLYRRFLKTLKAKTGRCLILMPPPRTDIGFEKFLASIYLSLVPCVRKGWLHAPCPSLIVSRDRWRPRPNIFFERSKPRTRPEVHLNEKAYASFQSWILCIICRGVKMTQR